MDKATKEIYNLLDYIETEFNECFNIDSEKTFDSIKKDIEAGALKTDKTLRDKFTRYIMNGCELIYYADIEKFLINKKVIDKDNNLNNDKLMFMYIDYMFNVYISYSLLNE